jgi:asparagine synthase (glutamine-hydrolysing)
MCGFAGIVGPFADRAVTVARMTEAIAHRGPDDAGAFEDATCALGHRRLSIIDLSAAGRQPMTNEDGTVQLAFNGEIYNFQELRAELVARGHQFRSRTDTEVIVHLYEERGDDLVRALRGMFAFALWDTRRRRLLLARDHFGQKPLFYAERGGALLFGSEIKALLAAGVDATPDATALDLLFRIQVVPSPYTCFTGIRRLPPATVLVREADGRIEQRRYWSLAGVARRELRLEDATEEVAAICDAAVTEQLVADVPIGVFVSGGVDSTIVLTASAGDGHRPQSFTLGYDERAYSEVDAARTATAGQDTDHHVVMMRPSDAADPSRLLEIFDEPFPDVAALPLLHLSRAARAHVKVALTGDGGDELFGGYEHHAVGYWLDRAHHLDRVRAATARFLRAAVPAVGARADKLQRVLAPMTAPNAHDAVLAMRTVVDDSLRRELFTDELLRADAGPIDRYVFGDHPGMRGLFATSGDRFLADRLLMKTDLATMAVGLESRCPLLDLRLAELAASLPPNLAFRGVEGKQVLRRVLARTAPRKVWRRRKTGFSMPLDQWLRVELRDLVGDTLLAPGARVAAYLRMDVLRRMYDEHRSGATSWRRVLWTALLVELWLRRLVRR